MDSNFVALARLFLANEIDDFYDLIHTLIENFEILPIYGLQAHALLVILEHDQDFIVTLPWVFQIYAAFYRELLSEYPTTDLRKVIFD